MDCSLPGFSIHGIFQARVLEWGAIAFSLALTRWTFVDKVMSLLFNMLSEYTLLSSLTWWCAGAWFSRRTESQCRTETLAVSHPSEEHPRSLFTYSCRVLDRAMRKGIVGTDFPFSLVCCGYRQRGPDHQRKLSGTELRFLLVWGLRSLCWNAQTQGMWAGSHSATRHHSFSLWSCQKKQKN